MSEFVCRCGGLFVGGKCEDCGNTRPCEVDGQTTRELEEAEARYFDRIVLERTLREIGYGKNRRGK